MNFTTFLEYIQDNGAIFTNTYSVDNTSWMFFMDYYQSRQCQILSKIDGVDKEFMTKREADVHCDKLRMRKMDGRMFDF